MKNWLVLWPALALVLVMGFVRIAHADADDYPDKCREGYIVKRNLFTHSGVSSPFRYKDHRYEENKIEVNIKGDRYQYSYKHCWSDGECAWIDSGWERLGRSSHGQAHTRDGYGAFFGTVENTNSFYVCWYRG